MATDPWMLCSRPQDQAPWRLFCFPHAGAGTSPYAAWSGALAPDIEVTAVCPPGRERHIKAPPHQCMATLVDALLPAIRPRLRPPYALFGHSLGALVAFALTLVLERENRGPAHLIVSGAVPPHLPRAEPWIYRLDDAGLIKHTASYGGLPAHLAESAEVLKLVLPALRADIEIAECYSVRPQEQVRCPVSAFGGLEDADAAPHLLAEWRDLTTGPFGMSLLPGGHFYLASQQDRLLHAIRSDLGSGSLAGSGRLAGVGVPAARADRIGAYR